jgi:hypothetical protein
LDFFWTNFVAFLKNQFLRKSAKPENHLLFRIGRIASSVE